MKCEKKKGPTPRQRLFTNEFNLGDKVCVIREEHGWHDGCLEGIVVSIGPYNATVLSDSGANYQINHPRDIQKL